MKSPWLLTVALSVVCLPATASVAPKAGKTASPVTVTEGTLTLPTYEHVGRYLDPPLFPDSTLTGLYPFTTYQRQWTKDSPKPETYRAIYVENEYVKLTYLPEMGGRFFALYDKIHHREVFYRNDVIKPTQFNPRFTWPQSGIELTGPYDAHTLTWHNEPYWGHVILRNPDGSVSVMLGETDPIYHMDVTYTATIVPGVAALKISTFCYNPNDGEKPQMLWSNAAFRVTPKLRFLYPMTQTVGHTTGVVSPWPVYEGTDLSWAHNNMHMLGVFGIDSYDNFGGSYEFDHDYGVFRYADRRVVQGMKMWTFGFGPGSSDVEHSYTDHAGPYFEAQSGRMVWDGHYEWVFPHTVEQWHEWWIPVAGIDGLTTLAKDVALHLEVKPDSAGKNSSVTVALSPVTVVRNARLQVTAQHGTLLDTTINLVPGTPVIKTVAGIAADEAGLERLQVTITAPDGKELLSYRRPDRPSGGDITPFARGLKDAPIPVDKMTAQQLVLAAEFKQKDLNPVDAAKLANLALKMDPGYSTAHRLLGMLAFNGGKFPEAAGEFTQAVRRDPYDSQSWYYLAVSEIRTGYAAEAERNLYYIWPGSAYYGAREYQLGRLYFLAHDAKQAEQHLLGAINSNGEDMKARLLLAIVDRDQGRRDAALAQLQRVSQIDPAERVSQAERYFLTGDGAAKSKLLDLMGEQTEDAIQVSIFYSSLERWKEAAEILEMVAPPNNRNPWGTSPVYFYTLAYDQKMAGDAAAAAENRKRARAATGVVERFPYRRQTIAPLEDAVRQDPDDTTARFELGCLLYYRGETQAAMEQWQAINQIDPKNYEARRSLGLAYEEAGELQKAVPELKQAAELQPESMVTLDDLANLYARTGQFDDQLALLQTASKKNPGNDHLVEAELNADLIQQKFAAAQQIVDTHTFKPVHRTYELRDQYRELKYGMGAQAFRKGDYAQALTLFESALKPPASLGMDDFELQAAPRIDYYIGRTLDAMGRQQEAQQAYTRAIAGLSDLTGGGSDVWTPDNFFMVFALDRLGRRTEAERLIKEFATVADSRAESEDPGRASRAWYLKGLIALYYGNAAEARADMHHAVQVEPDAIGPRYELSGDTIDPAAK